MAGLTGPVLPYLAKLARESNLSEAEVVALAFNSGVRQLWREQVLGRYLKGALTREDAIDEVGIDLVELAERQRKAALEDVAWALRDFY